MAARKLTAKERRELPARAFGIPSSHKYPVMILGRDGKPKFSKGHAVEAKSRAKQELEKGRIDRRQYNQIVRKADAAIRSIDRAKKKKAPAKRKVAKKKAAKRSPRKNSAETIDIGPADIDVDFLAFHVSSHPLKRNAAKRNPAPKKRGAKKKALKRNYSDPEGGGGGRDSMVFTVVRVGPPPMELNHPIVHELPTPKSAAMSAWKASKSLDGGKTGVWVHPPGEELTGRSFMAATVEHDGDAETYRAFRDKVVEVSERRANPAKRRKNPPPKPFVVKRKDGGYVVEFVPESEVTIAAFRPEHHKGPGAEGKAKKRAAVLNRAATEPDTSYGSCGWLNDPNLGGNPTKRRKNPSASEHERIGLKALRNSEEYWRGYVADKSKTNLLVDAYKFLVIAHEELKYSDDPEPRLQADRILKLAHKELSKQLK